MVTTKQLNVKRVCYVSRKPFREVLESLDAGVGHPDVAELWRNILEANTVSEVDEIMRSSVGSSGLIEFLRFNHGEGSARIPRQVGTGSDNPTRSERLSSS